MSRIIQCPSCEKTLKLGESSAKKPIIDCPVCAQKICLSNDSPRVQEEPSAPTRKQTSAKPARSHSTSETRAQRTQQPPRKRQSESRPSRSSRPTQGSQPRRRSKKVEAVRQSRRKHSSSADHSSFSIAMMAAGIILSFMGAIGATWWLAGGFDQDSDALNEQLVAEAELTVPEADGSDPQMESATTNADDDQPEMPSTKSAANTPQTLPPVQSAPEAVPPNDQLASMDPIEPNLLAEDGTSGSPSTDVERPSITPPATVLQNPEPPPVTTPSTTERSSVASTPDEPDDLLRYGLRDGDTHVYSFEVAAQVEGQTFRFPGSVSLAVSSGRAAGLEDTIHGTGTGFVVTEDGYLVTCHHVIEDAMVIEVLLNGKTYPAKVIASNRKQDLAIVKIQADGLPFVSLADSDKALLAEDVRAIGYPLTDLLGQGLKVTRGTISGINEDAERRRFQVDAAINPGNSGGPLFNERGHVIGVNSAKLYSDDTVSTVGFAVPSNYTKQLLQQNQITFDEKDGGPALSGPVLVQNVRTAVALLKVEKRKHINEQFVLNYTGHFNNPLFGPAIRYSGGPNGASGFTGETPSSGRVVVDEFGDVEDVVGANHLPLYTGNMATLMIHPLDPDGEKSWTREIPFLVIKAGESRSSYSDPGARFGGRFGGRRDEVPDEILTGGIETHQYQVIESNAREIKISRTYELRTLDHPTLPMATINGKGTITFDRHDMMPTSMDFRQTYEIQKDGKSLKIPMTIRYQRQSGTSRSSGFASRARNEAAARSASRKERIKEAALKAAERLAQKEDERKARATRVDSMTEEERLSFYLDEIKSKQGQHVYAALAEMPVIESRRQEVCSVLESCLESRRFDETQLLALAHWATPEVMSAMARKLQTLEPYNLSGRTRLIAALASTKNEQVIAPIIKVLSSNQPGLNDAARTALVELGPMAEDSLIAEMKSVATSIGVKTLGDIGGEKSIAVLEEIVKTGGPWLRRYANDAITKIKRRLG